MKAFDIYFNARDEAGWGDFSAITVTTDFIDSIPGMTEKYKEFVEKRIAEENEMSEDEGYP